MAEPRGKAFAKGRSGNPGGRPAKTDEQRTLEAMCREKTPEALAKILEIMDSGESDKVQLSAAQYVIDRGWGKAAQQMDVNHGVQPDNPLNDILSHIAARGKLLPGGTGAKP